MSKNVLNQLNYFLRHAHDQAHVVLVAQTIAKRVAKALERSFETVRDCFLTRFLDAQRFGLHTLAKTLKEKSSNAGKKSYRYE